MNGIDIRKCGFCKSGNVKLGTQMWTFSKLMGDGAFEVKGIGPVTGTCGHHCQGCKGSCYVRKSYRYGDVILGQARRTIAMRDHMPELFHEFDRQLSATRKGNIIVRLNQSGELESRDEFMMYCLLAEKHKDVRFYIYTKAYDIVIPALIGGLVPKNLVVLISVWHEYGVEEFKQVQHLPNVKAFVYDDGYNYEAAGIDILTYCKAYGPGGKLNHEITCERCRKCFNWQEINKVIGCLPH